MKGILIDVDDVTHKAFRIKLFEQGLTMKAVLNDFIREYLKDDDDNKSTKNSSKIEE